MEKEILFQHTGSDSLVRFFVFLWIAGPALFFVPGVVLSNSAWCLAGACILVMIAAGLRSTIIVSSRKVSIVRKWFFVPYWSIAAQRITDVSYDGERGLEEGAGGVVVQLDGRDVCIGSGKNMTYLHDSLLKLMRDDFSRQA
jgi:hypothetical protein